MPLHVGRQAPKLEQSAIFDDEFRARLYHSGRRAHEFHLFLVCNNLLGFQQHTIKNSGMPIIIDADYGPINK